MFQISVLINKQQNCIKIVIFLSSCAVRWGTCVFRWLNDCDTERYGKRYVIAEKRERVSSFLMSPIQWVITANRKGKRERVWRRLIHCDAHFRNLNRRWSLKRAPAIAVHLHAVDFHLSLNAELLIYNALRYYSLKITLRSRWKKPCSLFPYFYSLHKFAVVGFRYSERSCRRGRKVL